MNYVLELENLNLKREPSLFVKNEPLETNHSERGIDSPNLIPEVQLGLDKNHNSDIEDNFDGK